MTLEQSPLALTLTLIRVHKLKHIFALQDHTPHIHTHKPENTHTYTHTLTHSRTCVMTIRT